ncbi:hypothetical protein GW17_00059581 [Ensete ventricosum]|nr:hypothetical protein GW17_00059581 [Ensete ventricosum]
MSYEHGFMKKSIDHKLCGEVEFRSVFCAPSPKFKILAIPNVLAQAMSYEHGFMKKSDDHEFCSKSCKVKFRSVFRAPSRKYWPLPTY